MLYDVRRTVMVAVAKGLLKKMNAFDFENYVEAMYRNPSEFREFLNYVRSVDKQLYTRQELYALLHKGLSLDECYTFTDGQECMMFKVDRVTFNHCSDETIVYIGDLLGDVEISKRNLDDDEIECAVRRAFTRKDFVDEGYGNPIAINRIFEFVDWQSPCFQDVIDTDDFDEDDEQISCYGETYQEMKERYQNEESGYAELKAFKSNALNIINEELEYTIQRGQQWEQGTPQWNYWNGMEEGFMRSRDILLESYDVRPEENVVKQEPHVHATGSLMCINEDSAEHVMDYIIDMYSELECLNPNEVSSI